VDILKSTVTVNAAISVTVSSNIFGKNFNQSMKISTVRE